MDQTWLLLCATRAEWGPLKREISFNRVFDFKDLPTYRAEVSSRGAKVQLLLCQTGIGYQRASSIIPTLLKGLNRLPDRVVHFGLAGALDPRLTSGDLILANCVKYSGGGTLTLEPRLMTHAVEITRSLRLKYYEGGLLTSEHVLRTRKEKEEACRQLSALAVDMETYPVAFECIEREVPYLAVRAIFDPLDSDLSELDPRRFLKESGDLNVSQSVMTILVKPPLWRTIPQFNKAASHGTQVLSQFLLEYLFSFSLT